MRIHNQLGGFPMDVIGNYGMQYAKYADERSSPRERVKTIEYRFYEVRPHKARSI